ncbi:hypothetical protein [Actinoplanes sp. OR16]|uniref:hypothetical protein n=1 Tax=Actinoplanes sp. OR16 TaxID=946334 RepID=UPI00135F1BB0|nr:hypothetical protein [Actinoplanes sp. OR16]
MPVLVAVAGAGVAVLLAGCGGLEQANAAGVTPGDLVSEVATRLGTPGPAGTATYRVAGGETAQVTRSLSPDRTAYDYPGGRLIRTSAAVTNCAADVCTATDPADGVTLPKESGLVTDAQVVALLEAAAIDSYPEVAQRDTTLAGRNATCLALTGVQSAEASAFDVCVTGEGTLASFRGTLGGAEVDVVLTDYATTAAERDFQVPSGARLVDRRGD